MPARMRIKISEVTRKLKDLTYWGKNPNEMSIDEFNALLNSLRKFGYVDKIVIDEKGEILGGNHRATAIFNLDPKKDRIPGIEKLDGNNTILKCTLIEGLTQEEKSQIGLALNKIHGTVNQFLLSELISTLEHPEELLDYNFDADDLLGVGLDISGYESGEGQFETSRKIKFGYVKCPHCGEEFEPKKRDMKKADAVERGNQK